MKILKLFLTKIIKEKLFLGILETTDCPICKTLTFDVVEARSETLMYRCTRKRKDGRMHCGLSIMTNMIEKDRFTEALNHIKENSQGSEGDQTINKKFDWLIDCPICRYTARLTTCKNWNLKIQCAICPTTIFIRPQYLHCLYEDRLPEVALKGPSKPRKKKYKTKNT